MNDLMRLNSSSAFSAYAQEVRDSDFAVAFAYSLIAIAAKHSLNT